MEIYKQANADIERIKNQRTNEKRKSIRFSLWVIPLFLSTYFILERTNDFLNKRVDILFLGPVKIIATIIVIIFMLILFIAPIITLTIIRRLRTFNEMGLLIQKHQNTKYTHPEKLTTALLNMKYKPNDLHETIIYYTNLAATLVYQGKVQEGCKIIALLKKNPDSAETTQFVEDTRIQLKNYSLEKLASGLESLAATKRQ